MINMVVFLGHNSGLFVTSGEDMMKVLKEADGDVSKLEKNIWNG